jgi:dihydrofolate reductase
MIDMGKIVLSGPQNLTLDGVVQDPDGAEGFGRGGWFVEFGGEDLKQWTEIALAEALEADAWLLGRKSYEFFGRRWRTREGELAARLTEMPKYVVSSSLEDPDWDNTTVLGGEVAAEAAKLKSEIDGEIIVPASYGVARTLIAHDLVDELRVVLYPIVLGTGERLFDGLVDKKPMRLLESRRIGEGLVYLTYRFLSARG